MPLEPDGPQWSPPNIRVPGTCTPSTLKISAAIALSLSKSEVESIIVIVTQDKNGLGRPKSIVSELLGDEFIVIRDLRKPSIATSIWLVLYKFCQRNSERPVPHRSTSGSIDTACALLTEAIHAPEYPGLPRRSDAQGDFDINFYYEVSIPVIVAFINLKVELLKHCNVLKKNQFPTFGSCFLNFWNWLLCDFRGWASNTGLAEESGHCRARKSRSGLLRP